MGEAATPSSRSTPWIVAFAAAISLVAALSPRDLWAPDEPRYGRIAYEMDRGGSWLVSHFNGELDAEKPPLGYWIMAAAGKVAGDLTPVAARLPCALLAALAVFATAGLARRWFADPALGATAALLFATTSLVLANSSWAGLDLPLTACAVLATWAGTALVQRPSVLSALGCGAALGVGLLFKGPHVFYVPVGAVVAGAVAAGRARRLLDPRWLLVLATAAAVFCAWLLPALSEGGAPYRERLLGQLSSRLKGEDEPHAHAFPYLLGLVFAFGLPWTPAWVAGGVVALRKPRPPDPDRLGLYAALGGALIPLFLLSVAVSKREVYLLPLLPCLSILAAYALHRAGGERPVVVLGTFFASAAAATALVLFATPFAAPRLWPATAQEPVAGPALAEGATPWVLAVAGVAALAASVVAFRRRAAPVRAARAVAVGLGVAWVIAAIGILPKFDGTKTWDGAVGPVRAAAEGAPMVAVGFSDAALVWAMRPDDVPRLAAKPVDVPKVLDGLFGPGLPRVVAAVVSKDWERARKEIPSLKDRARVVWERRVGPRIFTVLAPTR